MIFFALCSLSATARSSRNPCPWVVSALRRHSNTCSARRETGFGLAAGVARRVPHSQRCLALCLRLLEAACSVASLRARAGRCCSKIAGRAAPVGRFGPCGAACCRIASASCATFWPQTSFPALAPALEWRARSLWVRHRSLRVEAPPVATSTFQAQFIVHGSLSRGHGSPRSRTCPRFVCFIF